MTRGEKVVLVFDDDSRLKGIVEDFRPERSRLALKEVDRGGHIRQIHDVDMGHVMAAFFVRDLAIWQDKPVPVSEIQRSDESGTAGDPGQPVRVTFIWGETLEAHVQDSDPRRRWFFLRPRETSGRAANVERVFVTRRAVAAMEPITDGG